MNWISKLIDFLLLRDGGDDYTGKPLPLYLREVGGDTTRLPTRAASCSKCGTKYLGRPIVGPFPEDGKCFRCSTGMERPKAKPLLKPGEGVQSPQTSA